MTILYSELKQKYSHRSIHDIPYQELLNTHEWKTFSNEVKDRDGYKCCHCKEEPRTIEIPISIEEQESQRTFNTYLQKYLFEESTKAFKNVSEMQFQFNIQPKIAVPSCLIEEIHLEVHHHYYVFSQLPWEYDKSALITLCRKCHQEVHDKLNVKIYMNADKKEVINICVCSRCNGSGYLKEYNYYMDGVCFECQGWGFLK